MSINILSSLSTLPNSKPLKCQQCQQCHRILTGKILGNFDFFWKKPVLTVLTVLTPPFFLFLGHFITFLLYLYISSSVDKSVDSVDRVYRLDIVGVRGSDLTVLLTALDAPLGAMFANRGRREGIALPHGGGDTMSSTTPTAEEDRPATTYLKKIILVKMCS